MKFTCGSCSAKYQIADEKIAGRTLKMKCRKCGHGISVKGASRTAETSSRPPRNPSVPPPPTRPSRPTGGSTPTPGGGSSLAKEFRRQASGPPATAAMATPSTAPGDEWHVSIDGQPVGPLSREEVARRVADGVIDGGSLTWREGFEAWRPLEEVAELASLVRARTGMTRPPGLPQRRGGSGASRPPTGRFPGARTTGRNNVVPIGAPRARTSAPPPVPADSDPGFIIADPDDTGADHTHRYSPMPPAPPLPGDAGGYGYGRDSLPPSFPPGGPPRRDGLSMTSPVFLLAAIGVGVFALGLAVVVGLAVTGNLGGGARSDAMASAETARDEGDDGADGVSSPRARVRLPGELDLDSSGTSAGGRGEGDRTGAEPSATQGTGADGPDGSSGGAEGGGDGARADARPAGAGNAAGTGNADRTDLSSEDQALLDRMRGGDISGPTIGARSTDSAANQRTASDLDERAVARIVSRNRRSLRQCYERAVRGVSAAPTITYEFDIRVASSGRVTRVGLSSRGGSLPGLDDCFQTVIKRWSFPPSAQGGPIRFPVVFSPGG